MRAWPMHAYKDGDYLPSPVCITLGMNENGVRKVRQLFLHHLTMEVRCMHEMLMDGSQITVAVDPN